MATTNLPDNYVHIIDEIGFVGLKDHMADDLDVVNGARVSFAKESTEMDEAGKALIKFLMRERHGTPFEHAVFKFHIKCPIFVAREWQRHRIGSFNEQSGRYTEFESEFYAPPLDLCRSQVGKPGSYRFEQLDENVAGIARKDMIRTYQIAFASYQSLLKMGLAKEVARNVLPVALYTQFIHTLNARSLMNFLSLRNSDTAQAEIREYAKAMEDYFCATMPVTHAAFVEGGRVVP